MLLEKLSNQRIRRCVGLRMLCLPLLGVENQESYTGPSNLVHGPENFEMTKFSEKLTLVRGSGL